MFFTPECPWDQQKRNILIHLIFKGIYFKTKSPLGSSWSWRSLYISFYKWFGTKNVTFQRPLPNATDVQCSEIFPHNFAKYPNVSLRFPYSLTTFCFTSYVLHWWLSYAHAWIATASLCRRDGRDRINLVQYCQYSGCWCPGSLRRQDTTLGSDYVE